MSDLTELQESKQKARNLIKKDMIDQSDTIKQRLAQRNRKKNARSMQRLDLKGVQLKSTQDEQLN